jgi:hypothetical protein
MVSWSFKAQDITAVSEALAIAEERTGDFYKFSLGQWKRHRYDVRTLRNLRNGEINHRAFALLNKYTRVPDGYEPRTRDLDFYCICLQDHQILKAVKRDRRLHILPLLTYVFTHELVHIVRFCNFSQRYEVLGQRRVQEEKVVHKLTHEILKDLSYPSLGHVFESYSDHRVCDMDF